MLTKPERTAAPVPADAAPAVAASEITPQIPSLETASLLAAAEGAAAADGADDSQSCRQPVAQQGGISV